MSAKKERRGREGALASMWPPHSGLPPLLPPPSLLFGLAIKINQLQMIAPPPTTTTEEEEEEEEAGEERDGREFTKCHKQKYFSKSRWKKRFKKSQKLIGFVPHLTLFSLFAQKN